jgi:hypothetical protein
MERRESAGHALGATISEVAVRERGPDAPAGAGSEHHVASPIPDSPSTSPAAGLSRRQAIGLATAAVVLPALDFTDAQAQRAAQLVRRATPAAAQAAPKFFTADEWEIVRLLVDYIIPKDDRSGSATDAQVPEFMDYMLSDAETNEWTRVAMRGGLAWLDVECRRRFSSGFVASSDAQRRAVLDDIAWPERARPEMSHGVTFFNRFRDLTASGFFSSAIGYKDLDFRGNAFVAEWTGCPPAALTKLGVRYAE